MPNTCSLRCKATRFASSEAIDKAQSTSQPTFSGCLAIKHLTSRCSFRFFSRYRSLPQNRVKGPFGYFRGLLVDWRDFCWCEGAIASKFYVFSDQPFNENNQRRHGSISKIHLALGEFFQTLHAADSRIPYDLVCVLLMLLRMVWYRTTYGSGTR